AIALARRPERERGVPVVPVFWVAGDDHDFAEANHASFLDAAGDLAHIVLRERPADAPLAPLARERCGDEIRAALEQLTSGTPATEFKADVLRWLEAAYRPDATLADACAEALNALLGPRGLAVLRAHDRGAKQAAAPWVLRGLEQTLGDGYTPVFVEAAQGRDRLAANGDAYVTRRSRERFTRKDLERLAREAPERLSPNVLLRPVVEAALLPTLAYAAVDPTLERTVQSARNAALAGTQEIEKKLIASLKRESETLLRQISRARDAVYPRGEPQERVLTLASFLIRYGPGLLDALGDEVARWADAP